MTQNSIRSLAAATPCSVQYILDAMNAAVSLKISGEENTYVEIAEAIAFKNRIGHGSIDAVQMILEGRCHGKRMESKIERRNTIEQQKSNGNPSEEPKEINEKNSNRSLAVPPLRSI